MTHGVTSNLRAENHYIPKMLMAPWLDSAGRIWVYRLLVPDNRVPHWSQHSTTGTGKLRNLYATHGKGVKSDILEKWFNEHVEQPALDPLRKAVAKRALNAEDRKRLAKFVIAQDLRTPASFLDIQTRFGHLQQQAFEETFQEIIADLESGEIVHPPDTSTYIGTNKCAFPLPVGVRIEHDSESDKAYVSGKMVPGKQYWLHMCMRIIENNVDLVANQDWVIVNAPNGVDWPLTDKPVVKLRFNSLADYDFNGALGMHGTEILFPLSPSRLAIISVGRKMQLRDGQTLDISTALLFRLMICEHAYRAIMMPHADTAISGIRPRIADTALYQSEKDAWSNWDNQESELLSEFEKWRLNRN